jgi:hypothetical protein
MVAELESEPYFIDQNLLMVPLKTLKMKVVWDLGLGNNPITTFQERNVSFLVP